MFKTNKCFKVNIKNVEISSHVIYVSFNKKSLYDTIYIVLDIWIFIPNVYRSLFLVVVQRNFRTKDEFRILINFLNIFLPYCKCLNYTSIEPNRSEVHLNSDQNKVFFILLNIVVEIIILLLFLQKNIHMVWFEFRFDRNKSNFSRMRSAVTNSHLIQFRSVRFDKSLSS